MKPIKSERGQTLIILALAAIGIFGIVGLAIDGSAKFSDRRHAQNAADAAALAGALALVNGQTTEIDGVQVWVLDALDRALENGYNDNHMSNDVWVYRCHEVDDVDNDSPVDCGPYNGNPDYIQVAIQSRVNTYFARVLGIGETVNTVQAVTYAKERGPFYDGNLIVALNPNPCSGGNGNVQLGGSSSVTLEGGGAFVNSGGSGCGMEQGGSCPTIEGGSLGSPGDGNINLDGCADIPTPNTNQAPYPFPPEMPAEPEECDVSNPGTFSSDSSTQTTTLSPGRFNEFPPKSGGGVTVYDNMIMNPGMYCVNDMIKLSDQHLILTGYDVTIYIRAGYDIDIQGGTITLDAPDTGPYAGYLLIIDSNFTGQVPDCHINGDSSNTYVGTIFAPYCDLIINGGNDVTSYTSQFIAYTVAILGNAETQLHYDLDNSAQNQPKIGLMR